MTNYKWQPIIENTLPEEIKKIHQQIWDYVLKHGRKPETPFKYDCVACEYASNSRFFGDRSRSICDYCPINWGDKGGCAEDSSLLHQWATAIRDGHYDLAKMIAKDIRNIPFKFETENEIEWIKNVEVEFLDGSTLSMSSFKRIREGVSCLTLYYGSELETTVDIPMKNIKSYRIIYKRK